MSGGKIRARGKRLGRKKMVLLGEREHGVAPARKKTLIEKVEGGSSSRQERKKTAHSLGEKKGEISIRRGIREKIIRPKGARTYQGGRKKRITKSGRKKEKKVLHQRVGKNKQVGKGIFPRKTVKVEGGSRRPGGGPSKQGWNKKVVEGKNPTCPYHSVGCVVKKRTS